MGGYGSGRQGHRRNVEGQNFLDVDHLHRVGCLSVGRRGRWIWSCNGEEVGNIDYRAEDGRLVLDYRIKMYDGEWVPICQKVPLTYVDCHYGGQRPYFRCEGVVNGRHCGRRVGRLYGAGKYFLCRHCYRLSYQSQSLDKADRLLRRANKTRKALGGEPGTVSWIPFKPKGMHQRTYDNMRAQIERDECQADQLFLSKFAHLFNQAERECFSGG